MVLKNISIEENTWKRLATSKINRNDSNYSQTIEYLLNCDIIIKSLKGKINLKDFVELSEEFLNNV